MTLPHGVCPFKLQYDIPPRQLSQHSDSLRVQHTEQDGSFSSSACSHLLYSPPPLVLRAAGIRSAGTKDRALNVRFFFRMAPKLRKHEAIPPVLHTPSWQEFEPTRKQRHFCVIPGFALLGYYAQSSDNSLLAFRGNLSVPSSSSKKFPTNYRSRNVGEELPLLAA